MNRTMPWWNRVHGTDGMASCLELRRTLQRYLDGEVDESTARRTARHLEVCRRCGLEEDTYRKIKRAVARRGAPPTPDGVRRLEALVQRLGAEGPPRRPPAPPG